MCLRHGFLRDVEIPMILPTKSFRAKAPPGTHLITSLASFHPPLTIHSNHTITCSLPAPRNTPNHLQPTKPTAFPSQHSSPSHSPPVPASQTHTSNRQMNRNTPRLLERREQGNRRRAVGSCGPQVSARGAKGERSGRAVRWR